MDDLRREAPLAETNIRAYERRVAERRGKSRDALPVAAAYTPLNQQGGDNLPRDDTVDRMKREDNGRYQGNGA